MCHRAKSIFTGLFLIALILPSCVTPVLVDYDREAALKFGNYKCFVIDVSDEQENSGDIVFSPIANRRFALELEAALKERGYVNDCSKPDFHIRFHTTKESITQLNFNYPIYALNFHNHHFQPDIGFFPPPYINQYQECTFLIDIIDSQSEKLVWRGAYTERLKRKPYKDEEIRHIIDKILDRFTPEIIPDSD